MTHKYKFTTSKINPSYGHPYWVAETIIEMPFDYKISFRTFKRYSTRIETFYNVFKKNKSLHIPFIKTSGGINGLEINRATQKSVTDHHIKSMAGFDEVIAKMEKVIEEHQDDK